MSETELQENPEQPTLLQRFLHRLFYKELTISYYTIILLIVMIVVASLSIGYFLAEQYYLPLIP